MGKEHVDGIYTLATTPVRSWYNTGQVPGACARWGMCNKVGHREPTASGRKEQGYGVTRASSRTGGKPSGQGRSPPLRGVAFEDDGERSGGWPGMAQSRLHSGATCGPPRLVLVAGGMYVHDRLDTIMHKQLASSNGAHAPDLWDRNNICILRVAEAQWRTSDFTHEGASNRGFEEVAWGGLTNRTTSWLADVQRGGRSRAAGREPAAGGDAHDENVERNALAVGRQACLCMRGRGSRDHVRAGE